MTETRDKALRTALSDWRTQTAHKFSVAACFILPQKTLDLLVETKPLTIEALLHVHGFAELKTSYFGHEILDVIEGVLSPEERALKEYADRRPIKSRCYLHDSSDSVKCPACGIIHKPQRSETSSTSTLLHQMMNSKPEETQRNNKKRRLQMTRPFSTEDSETCPLDNSRKPNLDKNENKCDAKCEKKSESGKKRKREYMDVKKEVPEEPILDVEFWNMADRVKKRAKKALRNKTPKPRKNPKRTRKPVRQINHSFASAEAPDLDSCSFSTLKTFLRQVRDLSTGSLSPIGWI